jgi:hypothetical protein
MSPEDCEEFFFNFLPPPTPSPSLVVLRITYLLTYQEEGASINEETVPIYLALA